MALTTVQSFLNDSRYDLKDQGKQKYDDTYLTKMLNRGIRILERELITINSDLTISSTTATLSTGNNYVELDKTADSVKRVYINQTELYHLNMESLLQRRIEVIDSSTGQPYYYSIWIKPSSSGGRQIAFDYTADADYTIAYIYNKLTSDLALTDYMPYDDMFNDYLREGIVMLCQKTKEKEFVQVDIIWRQILQTHIQQLSLAVNTRPKYYSKDF